MLCQAQLVGFVFFSFSAWPQICRAALLCGAVQADETKAANHIDFTSVPYEGPALKKGQELLAQSREQAKQETAKGPSLQRGWYYSGQLDHMVLWEKGACLPGRKRHATAAFSSCICVSLSLTKHARHRSVLADKAGAANSNPMYKTCNTVYGSQPTMAEVRHPQATLDIAEARVQQGS